MVFNSYSFLIFFPVVVVINFAAQKGAVSLAACGKLLLLYELGCQICIVIAVFYRRDISERYCDRARQFAAGKAGAVAVSFVLNIGVLFFFKYFDFAVDSLNLALSQFGLTMPKPTFDLLLPVGISFYTFQALSYTMDVYRGDIVPERNFFMYALFVSFFPQLVAGPIERSKNLLRQVNQPHVFDYDNMREGLLVILWGFFLKLVVADRVAIIVNTVYGDYPQYGGMYIIVASVLFAIQIYCDFAGYSTIAIGAAKVLGFQLMENFDCPYFSCSIGEFWRRWHISLSSWFRDYLYIPLGGNRRGTLIKYRNIVIVFLVSGLWHGAAATYVMWGLIHGIYQVIGGITKPVRDKLNILFALEAREYWS